MKADFEKKIKTYPSFNGEQNVTSYIYIPKQPPRGIVQVAHGMSEYFERYKELILFLLKERFIVCGNDHVGHGKSTLKGLSGDFGGKGFSTPVFDMHRLTQLMKKDYPDLDYFLFGHSMGSFLARAYVSHFKEELEGLILCATGNAKQSEMFVMCGLSKFFQLFGPKKQGNFFHRASMEGLNKMFKGAKTTSDWLSRDEEEVKRYINDPNCGFAFTYRGYEDLFELMSYVSRNSTIAAFPVDLPVLLIAGDHDPVGNFGKDVIALAQKLQKHSVKNITMRIYKGSRHEILNDFEREMVLEDILYFLESNLS